MKKFTTVCILAVIMGSFALEGQETSIGFRGGAVIGFHEPGKDLKEIKEWIEDEGFRIDEKSKMSFVIAGYGTYAVNHMLSIQAELNIILNQGIEWSAEGETIEFSYTSVDIPVLLRYSFSESIGLLAGPCLSIPVGKFKMDFAGDSEELDSDGTTFGLVAGLFGTWPVGSGRLIGDARVIFDMTPLKVKDYGYTMETFKRRGFAITVGYEMSL